MSVAMSPHGRVVVQRSVAAACRRIVRTKSETPAALAARIGVAKGTVDRWVSDLGWPNFIAAQRIAPLVGIDPATGKAVA